MTTSTQSTFKRLRERFFPVLLIASAIGGYIFLSRLLLSDMGWPDVRLQFDPAPLLTSPWVLKAHVAGALASFSIGVVLLIGVKGNLVHRTLGYGWLIAMTITAVTSFFLTELNGAHWSPIHALSAWTLIVMPMGLAAARRHNIAAHGRAMTGLVTQGIFIAGLFSFLPGRLMWTIFFAA